MKKIAFISLLILGACDPRSSSVPCECARNFVNCVEAYPTHHGEFDQKQWQHMCRSDLYVCESNYQ